MSHLTWRQVMVLGVLWPLLILPVTVWWFTSDLTRQEFVLDLFTGIKYIEDNHHCHYRQYRDKNRYWFVLYRTVEPPQTGPFGHYSRMVAHAPPQWSSAQIHTACEALKQPLPN